MKACWCCLPKIMKISPCLSKLQLAKLARFFLRQCYYRRTDNLLYLLPGGCALTKQPTSWQATAIMLGSGLVASIWCSILQHLFAPRLNYLRLLNWMLWNRKRYIHTYIILLMSVSVLYSVDVLMFLILFYINVSYCFWATTTTTLAYTVRRLCFLT